MRIAVSGNGYAAATNAFVDADQLAASTAHALMDALAHSAAMAGHTAASFAASYDEAAQHGVCSLVDLVDALANLGRMSEATLRNHAYAEARAVIGRQSATEVTTPGRRPTYSHLTPRLPPSSAGTRGHLIPGWAAWILDQVEGFVWPDSDVDRLRATAHAWRTASASLELVKAHCLDAAFSLSLEIAPDVDLAADAIRRFATHVDSLAQTFHGLARSCDDLADQVHSHREQVLEIVRDTFRDAVVIEGIGLVLGAVTGGITAAAASSVNGARIAAIAPRIIRIIEGLRIAVGASQTGARIAAASVTEARAGFQAFLKARIILSERGCAGIPLATGAAKAERAKAAREAPDAVDQKLRNYIHNLFKGATNPSRVGDGTTMDAIRHERATGLMTHGRTHITKGIQTLRGLERWLATKPDADPADVAVAKELISDLKDALG